MDELEPWPEVLKELARRTSQAAAQTKEPLNPDSLARR
jgi:hypothetical protein